MSGDFPNQIGDAAPAPTASEYLRRTRRLGLATAVLLYVLIIALVYFFNPHPAATVLALLPGLLLAALYEIPGGLAGAVVGTLIAAAWTARDAGWQWPVDSPSQSALLLTAGSFFGLGVLIGWVSRRERQRNELLLAALAEANQQRQQVLSILENAPVPVVIGDGGGRLRMANPAALEALGVKPPVALGQDIASLVADKGLADLIYQATLSNEQTSGQISGAQKRTLSARVSPVPGVGIVAVLQDISHLIELNERKTEMVRTVSHDLKNPLTAIKGYADLVVKAGGLSESQTQFIERVQSSATRMIDFVNDLLDVAWIEAGMEIRRELTDLAAIARRVV
jgi:PAS domain S-box-containing protein